MNYRFNFSFLHDWYNTNHVTKKEICMAVENTDFTSVNRWINGEQTMPTDSILRFCNYFEVPLECFFLDYDARASVSPRQPNVNDQTEPAGGYPTGKKKRGQRGVNPATTEHRPSLLPYVLITPNADGTVDVEDKMLESNVNSESKVERVEGKVERVESKVEGVEGNVDGVESNVDSSRRSIVSRRDTSRIRVIGIDDEDDECTPQTEELSSPQTEEQPTNTKHPTPTIQHPTPTIQHPSPNTQTEELLQLRLAHQLEINNIMTQYHERVERVRTDYEHKLETEKERLYRIIEQQSNAIANFQSILKNGGKYPEGITEDSLGLVAEDSPTNS